MRIGVDATSWSNRRGYGRFTRNAIRRLVELDSETEYVLYVEGPHEGELPPAEIRTVQLTRTASRNGASSRKLAGLLRFVQAARASRVDAFLFPSVYEYFAGVGVPTVVGVHDLIARTFPQLTLSSQRARVLWRLKEAMAIRGAHVLFTVSESSRASLAARLGIEAERLAVVPEAPDPVFFPREQASIAPELRKIGLEPSEPFLLYAGGISPHKSLDTLIDAYDTVRRSRSSAPRLVLAGELERDPYLSAASEVRRRIEELGLGEQVLLPGFVSDEALACLYTAAIAVISPSLAEGFGLPPVEAAACGAVNVLSDIPAHRESLADAALYFPPRDAAGLARALERLITDAALRSSLQEQARHAVAGLSWDATAERLGQLVRRAASTSAGAAS